MGVHRYCKDEIANINNYYSFCDRHRIPPSKYIREFNPSDTGDGIKLLIAYCEVYGDSNKEILEYLRGRMTAPRYAIYSLADEYMRLSALFKPEWTLPMTVSRAIIYEYCMKHKLNCTQSFTKKLTGVLEGSDLLRLLHYDDSSLCLFGMGYTCYELQDMLSVILDTVPHTTPTDYVWSYVEEEIHEVRKIR